MHFCKNVSLFQSGPSSATFSFLDSEKGAQRGVSDLLNNGEAGRGPSVPTPTTQTASQSFPGPSTQLQESMLSGNWGWGVMKKKMKSQLSQVTEKAK